jgi:hypothetical protein
VLPTAAKDAAEAGAKALESLGKGLGVVADVLSVAGALGDVLNGGNAGDVVNLVGATLSAVGTALASTGVGVPVAVLGSLVSIVGGLISEHEHTEQLTAEETEILGKIGLGDQAAALVNADPEALQEVAEHCHLSPEQVVALAQSHPEIFADSSSAYAFAKAAIASGVKGSDAVGFADALKHDDPDYLVHIENIVSSFPKNQQATLASALRNALFDPKSNPSTAKWIHENEPQLFDEATQQRQQADVDVDQALAHGGTDPLQLISSELRENTSPAYRAEVLERLDKLGQLDNWAKQQAISGDARAAKAAVDAAEKAGVISHDRADELRKEIDG